MARRPLEWNRRNRNVQTLMTMMMITSLIFQSANQQTNKKVLNTEQRGVEITMSLYSGSVDG
jgi:hypothetical protein